MRAGAYRKFNSCIRARIMQARVYDYLRFIKFFILVITAIITINQIKIFSIKLKLVYIKSNIKSLQTYMHRRVLCARIHFMRAYYVRVHYACAL